MHVQVEYKLVSSLKIKDMSGQDIGFVYQFGYIRTYTYCVFVPKFLDILISGCPRQNIVKGGQNYVGMFSC